MKEYLYTIVEWSTSRPWFFLSVYFEASVDDSVVEKYLLPKEQVLEQENLNERVSSRLEGD